MKHTTLLSLVLFITAIAVGQQPIKVNLLEYFDKVTPPPATAKDAYEKCDWTKSGRHVADNMFKSLEDSLERFQAAISLPAGGPNQDMAKNMQDPEFKKKMKKMTKEEKMQMAMQMSQNMQPGAAKPESEAVTKTMRDCSTLTEESTKGLGGFTNAQKEQVQRVQDLVAKHKAVDDWETAEINKLPVTPGEGATHDPKAVSAVRQKALNKHIAIVDEDLKRTGKIWSDSQSKLKQQFAEYEADLESIHFGDDAQNNTSRAQISSGQTRMVSALTALARDAKNAYLDAAPWYQQLVESQKRPPIQ